MRAFSRPITEPDKLLATFRRRANVLEGLDGGGLSWNEALEVLEQALAHGQVTDEMLLPFSQDIANKQHKTDDFVAELDHIPVVLWRTR